MCVYIVIPPPIQHTVLFQLLFRESIDKRALGCVTL